MNESEAARQARCALGAELAAYRRAAGYTQAEFSRLTEFSRSTTANVETGRQHVDRPFWERADTILRTGGVLARGYDDLETTSRRELRATARNASRTRKARTAPLRHDLTAPTASRQPGHPPGTPQGTARLLRMREHLKAIDNALGGQAALPMTEWYLRHEVLPLLNAPNRELTCRWLTGVAAQFEHDAGWMAYDADRQEQAGQHLASALRLARAAGDRLFGARVLAALSHQAIYLGRKRQAIDFAQAARAAARQIATPRMVAMLATMEACAHAAAGDAWHSQQSLDEAAGALAQIGSGQLEPGWLDFDEGGYWGHAARVYRDLGQAAKAEQYAARSVGLCLPRHARTRTQRTTIHATAFLQLGDADAAATAAELVVSEAWNLHSGRVFGEVAELAAAIKPYKTAITREFGDQADELLAARAPALASGTGR